MSNAAYGLLGAPLAMAALPLFVQLPAYYATHLGMALGPLGVLLFVARGIDMLQDPLLGHLLDRTPAQRRRWMLLGAVVLVLAFAALWLPPADAGAGTLGLWIAPMLVLAYGAHSLVNIAYLSWGAQLTGALGAAAWREGMGLAGMIAASLAPAAILGGDPTQVRPRLAAYGMAYALLMLLAMFALLRYAPRSSAPIPPSAWPASQPTAAAAGSNAQAQRGDAEVQSGDVEVQRGDVEVQRGDVEVQRGDVEVQRGDVEAQRGNVEAERGDAEAGGGASAAIGITAGATTAGAAASGWRGTMRALTSNRPLRALLLPYFLNALSVAIPATLALFYIADQLGAPQLSGVFLACYFGAAACGLPVWAALARKYGALRCWRLGMLLSVAGFCGAALLGNGDLLLYAGVCVAAGVALGADLALPPVLLGRLLGEQLNAGFGLFTMLGKLALAIAGLALPLLSWLDYQPGQGGGISLVLAYAVLPCLIKLAAMAALNRCNDTLGSTT